jgi:hypothetical protein
MRLISISALLIIIVACTKNKPKEMLISSEIPRSITADLDTIWSTEQEPITMRDSLMKIYGAESKEADVFQKIYRKNHAINIKKIRAILDNYGWPETSVIGEQGNRTICNVLQHADQGTRESYLPMMKQAVLDKKPEPRYLVRAKDRIATDKGELQIYGGK